MVLKSHYNILHIKSMIKFCFLERMSPCMKKIKVDLNFPQEVIFNTH